MVVDMTVETGAHTVDMTVEHVAEVSEGGYDQGYAKGRSDAVNELRPEIDKIRETAENAEAVAKGRATGYVFDTVGDLDLWLEDAENTARLVLGDNLYIRATDVPDYWWDGAARQPLETQKVDLSEYVKNTDYPDGSAKAGVVKVNSTEYGIGAYPTNGHLYIAGASRAEIAAKAHIRRPVVPALLDYAVKVGLTANTEPLTDEEKAKAKAWLGISSGGGGNVIDTKGRAPTEEDAGGFVGQLWQYYDSVGSGECAVYMYLGISGVMGTHLWKEIGRG